MIDRAQDVIEQARALSGGGVDVVLDVVAGDLVSEGVTLLREGGRWVVAGALGGHTVGFDVRRLYLRNAHIIGSTMHTPSHFGLLMDIARQAHVRPTTSRGTGATRLERVTKSGYDKPHVAQVYDAENSGRWDLDFYLALAEELSQGIDDFAVLDIGCGTGALGVELAQAGHQVTGVDPAEAMLESARTRPGSDLATWIHGYANDVPDVIADLVIMTGHVAQYFITDDAWDEVLQNAHRALRPGGRIAFESRNPGNRAWERWTRDDTIGTYPHPDGGEFTSWVESLEVNEEAPEGVIETHRGITVYPNGTRFGDDTSETLIFRPIDRLTSSLETAGFTIEHAYGDWSRGPVTEAGVEHILIARRD